jgi:potassium-dependent mechanosensitive channel
MWASFLISKFLRFLLEEDVYQHFLLPSGIPFAISTVLHYLILVIGFFIALGALGIDLTKITILAGAISVGVGIGLQNVVNNFVSGLILLFERPIKIGDTIEVGGNVGEVRRKKRKICDAPRSPGLPRPFPRRGATRCDSGKTRNRGCPLSTE